MPTAKSPVCLVVGQRLKSCSIDTSLFRVIFRYKITVGILIYSSALICRRTNVVSFSNCNMCLVGLNIDTFHKTRWQRSMHTWLISFSISDKTTLLMMTTHLLRFCVQVPRVGLACIVWCHRHNTIYLNIHFALKLLLTSPYGKFQVKQRHWSNLIWIM